MKSAEELHAMSDAETLAWMGTDAQRWAEAFAQLHPGKGDPSLMIGWFANAIEAGRSAGAQPRGRRCLVCKMITWNPTDVVEGYCVNCHDWTPGELVTRDGT